MITAAHCTNGTNPSELFVRIGDTSLDEEFEATSFTIGVANITQHPGYDYDYEFTGYEYDMGNYNYEYNVTNENDIAVLELNQTVSLTEYPHIKPACLPAAGALFHGEATLTGWGSVDSLSPHSASLNEVDMTVLADEECENLALDYDYNNYQYTLDIDLDMGEDLICVGSNDSTQGRLVFSFKCLFVVVLYGPTLSIFQLIIFLFSRCSCLLRRPWWSSGSFRSY